MEAQKQEIQVGINPAFNYVNAVKSAISEEEFITLFICGNQGFQFVFSPKHLKRFSLLLERQVKEYEEKFGVLETSLPEKQEETSKKSRFGF